MSETVIAILDACIKSIDKQRVSSWSPEAGSWNSALDKAISIIEDARDEARNV